MEITVDKLLEAGVHFGHRVSRRNPKMEPFIFGKRNLINIIDLRQTLKGTLRACHFLHEAARAGKQILYVGTKRQARNVIKAESQRAEMHVVTERWLGGSLTNFNTIRLRLRRLEELEATETDGSLAAMSKKMQASVQREKRKIKRNLEGLRKLDKRPDVLIVVDPKREYIAVKEANKLNIPIVALLDTDCDPTPIDLPIPGNDDAMRSIELIVRALTDAVVEGRRRMKSGDRLILDVGQPEAPVEAAPALPSRDEMRRRRRKTQVRKGDETEGAAPEAEEPEEESEEAAQRRGADRHPRRGGEQTDATRKPAEVE